MVKTPKTRHSNTRREPMTIELDPADISRVDDPAPEDRAQGAGATEAHVEPGAVKDAPADKASGAEAAATNESTVQADTAQAEATQADTDFSTETGTATQPEQEYQPAEAAQEPSGYGFDETESKPAQSAARESPKTAIPPPPPRRDGFSRIAAGVIGGVVALAAAGGLQYAGLLGTPAGQSGGDQLGAEVEALKQEVAALKDAAGSGDATGQSAELVSGLEAAKADIDAVKTDVAALKDAISSGGGGDAAAAQALDTRLKEVETAVSALGQATAPDAAALSQLGERTAAVEALVKSTSEASATTDGKLAALEQSVSALTGRVDTQAQQPKIALAIATAALKSAVDRGAAFQAELETFAAIVPNAPELEALRSHAEKGVPTREALLSEVEPAAAAMIAAAKPADPNSGFFDRLLDSAESLVSVRPVGEVQGAGVPETVARMQVALTAGDLDKAIAEFDALPDAAKAAAGSFGENLKARRDVERLVDQAIAGAMKA
ncbi:phage tail protein [Mesorhizobium sp. LHD-90]|uniref:COG4223 family protein n=1 Tax=Mesorhizobium sp. LHD-90 TaxID=3071414 RepID=UPI0027DEF840|nr:phage tail protein [Mesorhizobium sp. LHD-90]MDQ6437781.1 phage tail protein [Mesorhizobium sp. LHD-90]